MMRAVRLSFLAAIVLLACSCGGGGGSSKNKSDKDIVVTGVSGATTEAGGQATFTLVLSAKPKSDVVIPVAASDTAEVTVSPAQVTFTRDNWEAPQTVALTGVDDDLADGHQLVEVQFGTIDSSDKVYANIELPPIPVTNLDNDTAGVLTGPASGPTDEGGTVATVPVVLLAQPSADVVLIFGSSDPFEGEPDVQILTFTPQNWNAPQTITVTGVDDDLADGLQEYEILFQPAASEDPRFSGILVDGVALANVDNDVPSIIVEPPTGITTEGGAVQNFAIRLGTRPGANVVLELDEDDTSEGDLPDSEGVTLQFTPMNWSTAQIISVTGDDDSLTDGNVPYALEWESVFSLDPGYNGLTPAPIQIVNMDDESPDIFVSPIAGFADETGGQATFSVVLTADPSSDVIIPVSVSDETEGVLSHSSIEFTGSAWDDPQIVVIGGVGDFIRDGNQPFSVVFGPAISSDPFYSGRQPLNLLAHTLDDGSLRSVLVFDDGLDNGVVTLLTDLGYGVTATQDLTTFDSAFDAGGFDVIVWESSVTAMLPATEARLESWVTGGGRLILSAWDLDTLPALSAALDVSATPYASHRFVYPQPIGLFDVFEIRSAFPFPLTGLDNSPMSNGHELVVGTNGTIAATSGSLSGPASIAITNMDRVIVNGFTTDDMDGTDNDGDGVDDLVELYRNELEHLFFPPGGRFDVLRPQFVPGLETITSTRQIGGIAAPITEVEVSLSLSSTSNSSYDIWLVAPDGTRVELSTDNGGSSGPGYGTSCADQVTFDDDAATSITTQTSSTNPITGTYKPEHMGGLAVLDGLDPNGEWTLEITDDSSSITTGTLRCWSLTIQD